MKKITKFLTLALSLIMIFARLNVSAFAATESKVKQYGVYDPETGRGGYVAFGDSVFRGCGATEHYSDGYDDYKNDGSYYEYEHRIVNNSAPYIIAQAIGCTVADDYSVKDPTKNTFVNCCFPGQTLTQVMDSLGIEHDYRDNDYDHGVWAGTINNFANYCSEAADAVKRANLITIELGMCDVFWRSSYLAGEHNSEKNLDYVTELLEEMYAGYDRWVACYPKFIEQLQAWNSDVTIVLVGNYNVAFNMALNDDSVIPVGTALSSITALMNQKYEQWAEDYGCIYVDISNVDTAASQNNWSIQGEEYANDPTVAGHPSVEGNTYMGRQVVNALPLEDVVKEKTSINDIVLDLGRFKFVSAVLVDNVAASDYEMTDEYELTVHWFNPFAKLLTVIVKQEDGKIASYSYQLSNDLTGYKAYRIYSTNDVTKTVSTAARSVNSVGNKVVGALSNLFKK